MQYIILLFLCHSPILRTLVGHNHMCYEAKWLDIAALAFIFFHQDNMFTIVSMVD